MKIIALFPVKNEDWILGITLPVLKKFADEIIALDGGSTDETLQLLNQHGVIVRKQDLNNKNYSSWRQELLDAGRERGGTHFVWIDADEAFTTNFLVSGTGFRNRLAQMKPGEKLALQWLCLWKSPFVYRNDDSIWSNLYKDFIVCDDGKIGFGTTMLHESRTPGPNEISGKSTWTKIPASEGAVLHFQFVPFMQFQIKQAFQRCREYVLQTGSAPRINYKYTATLDNPKAKTEKIPQEWLAGIEGLDTITDNPNTWYDTEVLRYFNEKGVMFFESLQIWHIPKYLQMFKEKAGKQPKIKTYPKIIILLNKIKNALIK